MKKPNENKIEAWRDETGWKKKFLAWLKKTDACQQEQIQWLSKHLPKRGRMAALREYMALENAAIKGTDYDGEYSIVDVGVEGETICIIRANGMQEWWKNGNRHRDNDQPALIRANGTQQWFVDDKPHRDNDQPAYIGANGTQAWWRDGKLHRDNDQPAIIYADGKREWWRDDKFVRREKGV